LFGSGLNPAFFTLYNGKVLFNGADASGDDGLWVTDGIANGTHEITGIVGADITGLDPSDMTIYNGKVYFNGLDIGQTAALWVTDGTAAGTHELTGIAPDPSDLTVLNGKLVFNGFSADGSDPYDYYGELWETDGTAAGTVKLTGISNAPAADELGPSGFTPVAPATLTSNSILWQNTSSGQAAIWNMTGTNVSGGGAVSPNPGRSWTEIGSGDFNHDGHSDILWQNASTGQASSGK
jgi:ELWxxDGT repeat protein